MRAYRKLLIPILSAGLLLSSCGIIPEEESLYATPTISNVEPSTYITSVCTITDIYQEEKVSVKYIPVQTVFLNYPLNNIAYGDFFVSSGDFVEEGQLLAELDMGTLREDIASMEQSIRDWELELSQLEDSRAMSLKKQKYDGAWMDADDLQRSLDQINKQYDDRKQSLQDQIDLTTIRIGDYRNKMKERQIIAPFDGIVTYVAKLESGELSSVTKKVITLTDSSLSIFRMDTKLWPYFSPGDHLTAVVNEREYAITVADPEEIGLEPVTYTEGKSCHVYLTLDEPAFDLQDNTKGSVTIVTVDRQNVLAVPVSAVSTINGESVVYYLGDDGLRTYKTVTIGEQNDKYVEIIDGLEAGDEVIIN